MKQPSDHQRSLKKPVRKTVWIAGDTELADELSELEASLSRAKYIFETMKEDDPRREAALLDWHEAEEMAGLKKDEVRATAIKFVFEGLSPKAYDKLLAAHPPTAEQIKAAKDVGETNVPFNTDTFPIVLITACCVEPEMATDDLAEWLDDGSWNQSEVMSLFMAATEANQSRKILNLGKG